jgi:outer membrane protein assembly factor BamB
LLLESSIRLRSTPNSIDIELEQLYENSTEDHTFFVSQNIAPYFNTLFEDMNPVPWSQWSTWTALVPTVNSNGVYMQAYGVMDSSGASRLSFLKNQDSALQNLAAHIPSNVNTVQAFSFDLDTYKKASLRFKAVHNLPETVMDSLLMDATQLAQLQLGNETLVLVKTNKTPDDIKQALAKKSKAQYTTEAHTVYAFSDDNSITNLLPPILKQNTYAFATLLNEHLYLGTSKTALESLIYALTKDDVLAQNERFQTYVKTLPSRSSFWGWSAPAYFEAQVKKMMPALRKVALGAFRQADYVGTVEGEVFYVALSLQKPNDEGKKTQAVELAGTATFNTPVSWGPYAVLNHKTQALEWVIQDEENQLYLLDTTGEEIWKKQLDGAILGPVYQVDLYRNKRLQLAFTTDKSFQVLDRNGNPVSGYNKKGMRTSSTLGIFDYDNQRNYRLVLSSGNTLSMYDRSMKKVSGWRKTKLKSALKYPAKHIRIGNRDYIALVQKSGKGELLHRTGKTRIKIPTDVKLTQEIYPYQSGFVSIDDKNRLVQISTTGKLTKTALPFETRYTIAANRNTLVTLTENKVSINDQLVELDFGVYAPPQIQVVNNRTYILIWDNQSDKVYVFNRDAKLLDSFPVIGRKWAMLGQAVPGSAIYLAAQNNKQELRIYKMP